MFNKFALKSSLLLASIMTINAHASEPASGGNTSLPMPTLYGSFDVSLGLEIAEETGFALSDSIGDANYLGVKGHIPLSNGSKINYVHEEFITLVDGAGIGGSYQTYLGYETENGEVRVGNLDTPLKRVLDSVDLFAGTYADLTSIVPQAGTYTTDTTANSAVMYLGGGDNLNYAVSLDTQASENANDADAVKKLRLGAMAEMQLGEQLAIGAGFEHSDPATAFGLTAKMQAGDTLAFNASLSMASVDVTDTTPMTFTLGGSAKVGEDALIKAQLGMRDPDVNGADNALLFALGYDKQIIENLTAYGLFGMGDANGLTTAGQVDIADAAAKVLAVGVKFTF